MKEDTDEASINKECELSIGLLLKNVPEAYIFFSPDLRVIGVTNSYLNKLQLTEDQLLGKNLEKVLDHLFYEDGKPLNKALSISLEKALANKHQEIVIFNDLEFPGSVASLFSESPAQWTAINTPVLNSFHEVLFLMHKMSGSDGSEEPIEGKLARKELEISIDKLRRSNEELEQFAYVASHDLQEPLRKIRAFGERLAVKFRDNLGEEGKDYIDRMQNAASRMQTLIDDLLAYSKLSRSNEEHIQVDLSEIVKDVLNDLEIPIEQKKASIKVDPLPLVMANQGQMRQLFQNIISNALKFNPPGNIPTIEVRSEILDVFQVKEVSKVLKKKQHCRITIKDYGIGFEEKFLERIFVIFQRLHGRSEYAGTGIGLAICKKIVENHNGHITAESKVNEGSAFIITLPIA
jgi:signal transduction histidine kinase